MKVFSQLEKAQLENTTSDTGSLPKGMITYRTDLNIAKVSNGTSMLALIDESSTQTLSGKTYATPNFTGAFNMAQTTTPANPSAGNNKFYFKADGKLYTLDSSGNEALVGSGTGGVKNLITNGNADDTSSSIFVPYADTGTRPVDGTGGSPTVTTSISSSTPLDGVKSFLLTKPASNVQGQGWAVPFTVDPAYRAKSLKISVDYIVNSGTFVAGGAGVESDVIWYIYDVTNSVLIEPSNIKMFSNNSSIADKFEATFQSSATGSSYRLIAHVQSTSALAYELKVDNIAVSPQSYMFGTPVTDWQSYIPTITGSTTNPTKGTATIDSGKWRRVGDSMEITYSYRQTSAGTAGSGAYIISLPSGFSIDTTKIIALGSAVGGDVYGISGNFAATGGGANPLLLGTVHAIISGVSGLMAYFSSDLLATNYWGNGDSCDLSAANLEFSISAKVPIVGWSSSVQTSDNADTRITTARITASGSTSIAGAAVPTKMVFGSIVYDTHGAYSIGSNRFIAPTSGFYRVAASVRYDTASWTANNRLDMYVYKNGAAYSYLKSDVLHSTGSYYPGSLQGETIVQVNAGDYLEVFLVNPEATARNTITDSSINFVTFEKLTGPSAIAASELVSAQYSTGAGQAVPNATITLIDFASKDFDSHNAVTTGGSWKFTAPISGTYQVSCQWAYAPATYAGTSTFTCYLYKNGSSHGIQLGKHRTENGSTSSQPAEFGMAFIKLKAGDYIDFRQFQDNGLSENLEAANSANYVSIVRVGM